MQLKVLFFNFVEGSLLPIEVKEHFKDNEEVAFESIQLPLEASAFLQENDHTVFVFLSKDKQDFSQIKLLLKRFKKKVHAGQLKPVAILGDHNRDTFSVLNKLGCSDVFNYKVSAEHLIQIIESTEEKLILNDPELAELEGFDEELDDEMLLLSDEAEEILDEARIAADIDTTIDGHTTISSGTDVQSNEEFHNKVMEHPQLGGISLESGSMEVQVSPDMPADSKILVEHFSETELEFEVQTEQAVNLKAGDKVDVQVVFAYDRCRVEILIDGIVSEINQENELSSIIGVQLSQDESLKLEQFMAQYQKRQVQIQEFMELAKDGILYSPSKKAVS